MPPDFAGIRIAEAQAFRISAVCAITFVAFGEVALTSDSSMPRCVSIDVMCACISSIFIIGAASFGIDFPIIESRRGELDMALGPRVMEPAAAICA